VGTRSGAIDPGVVLSLLSEQQMDVCPVDCIHPTQNEEGFETAEQLYINPDECIDCGACEPACPVTAIFEESAVPEEWQQYIKINADFFKTG
jgi:NAD-dependent dihydropyrimidine dehydrogenase PreA subunit